ncbi:MAG TPA: 50S ribosomal protein L33 [Terriglobia bacterium]|jgi:large subunit ribosomal protein L33|nr:50S ribosomal protein L33 [Terriglobia bacterium]
MRDIITLQCNDCKNRNYTTTKNKKKHTDRLEIKRFCPKCRQHKAHREVK